MWNGMKSFRDWELRVELKKNYIKIDNDQWYNYIQGYNIYLELIRNIIHKDLTNKQVPSLKIKHNQIETGCFLYNYWEDLNVYKLL